MTVLPHWLAEKCSARLVVALLMLLLASFALLILYLLAVWGPEPPEQLQASQGASPDYVILEWDTVEGTESYRVFRDGQQIATVREPRFRDEQAKPGGVPEAPVARASVHHPDRVELEWNDGQVPKGALHVYTVTAVDFRGEGSKSEAAVGYRSGYPLTGYEVQVNGGEWIDVGLKREFIDRSAQRPTIEAGRAVASKGEHAGFVVLTLEEDTHVIEGIPSSYHVRASNQAGISPSSEAVRGHTASGELSIQWQWSDSADEEGFVDITDASSRISYDSEAMADGSPRYYWAILSAPGAEEVSTEPIRGYRGVLPRVRTLSFKRSASGGFKLTGRLNHLGIPEATEIGFCIGAEPEPTDCMPVDDEPQEGHFSFVVDDLAPRTEYFARAYASNKAGRGYGDDLSLVVGSNWKQVSVGLSHLCAIDVKGRLYCWGRNARGQLGTGDLEARETPSQVGANADWKQVVTLRYRTCGIRQNGTLWCWGESFSSKCSKKSGVTNEENRTQQKSTTSRQERGWEKSPRQLTSATDWKKLAAGGFHYCGIRNSGSLWCWGVNGSGQLGHGDTDIRCQPEQVGDSFDWEFVDGGSRHTCGIRADGTLWCWGANGPTNILGISSASLKKTIRTPTQIDDADGWKVVTAGRSHTCGIKKEGTLWCWGATFGRPSQVDPHRDWQMISSVSGFPCGIRRDGTFWCWGRPNWGGSGDLGRLGLSTEHPERIKPKQVGKDTDWARAWAGYGSRTFCGIRKSGALSCLGVTFTKKRGPFVHQTFVSDPYFVFNP